MSDLKHQSVKQLLAAKEDCEKYIAELKSKLEGQKNRLVWISKYLYEKTPQELSLEEIENKLGHKVIIKE